MTNLLINVVTIEKNNLDGLFRTMRSIGRQEIPEGVIVRQLICQDSNGIPSAPISELGMDQLSTVASLTDSGIYNAMNKGLSAANLGWILFLNSGDELLGTDSFYKVARVLRASVSPLVQFKTAYSDGSIHPRREYGYLSLYLGRDMHAHPSLFVNTQYFSNLSFDESYRIAGDYKCVLQIMRAHKPEFSEEIISLFEGGGISSTEVSNVILEMNRVRLELKPKWAPKALIDLWNSYVKFRIESIMNKKGIEA